MKLLVTSAFSMLVLSSTAMSQSQEDGVDQTASIVCSAKSNNGFCDSINYTSFAIPNFRNSTEEMEIDIELQTYTILYSSGCSNALVHLLCGYYKPPCYSGPNAEAIRLTPCRELCLYVRSSCEPVIAEYNAASTWPDHLDCDQFPLKGDENGTICFPNFHALEDYQTRLELPPILGAPIPSTVVTAERFWSPVCEVNEYVHPTSGVCTACPTNSTSVGGTPSMCTCNAGTGRVNATDVTLPCVEPPCPPECSHKFCQKNNPNALCSVPGEFTAPSCTGTCHVTNCRACYYSRTVQTCQKHCKYDCGENPSLRCLKKWSQCVKKGLQKNGQKRAKTFKCVDPCKC